MNIDEDADPTSVMRVIMLRVMLNTQSDELELTHCLDTKTGEECDVVFVPVISDQGDPLMIPGFPVPTDNVREMMARYVPISQLPKTNPAGYYNN